MPEAESELVAGFFTEYSGMRFAFFFIAEYANMVLVSCVAAALFLGGWNAPYPGTILGHIGLEQFAWAENIAWFTVKVYAFLFLFFWLRATLMQAGTPLINAFVMESLPPALRARASSLNNTVWNAGWAASATLSGLIIQRFGYAVPFYITAVLYATAALTFMQRENVAGAEERYTERDRVEVVDQGDAADRRRARRQLLPDPRRLR